MRLFPCLLAAALCLVPFQALQAGPFDSNATVKIVPTGGNSTTAFSVTGQTTFEKNLENTERQITKGIKQAGTALDQFSADLGKLVQDLKSAGTTNGAAIAPGGCYGSTTPTGAQSPQAPGNTAGAQLGTAFKDFVQKVGDMFKAIGKWGKALWNEITGPSKEEAPITSTINGIKTDWAGNSVKQTAKTAGQSTIGLFTSIGNFFKSLFQ